MLLAINWATVGIKAVQLILSLSILVILHEFGHYITAKWFKCRVEKFYLFFDAWFSIVSTKKINGKRRVKFFTRNRPSTETIVENGEKSEVPIDLDSLPEDDWRRYPEKTTYGIGWLPLGGYVKIAGMIDESMDKDQMAQPAKPYEFRSKPAWQRLIIMLAGITVNVLLGFFIYAMMLWHWGESYLPTENVKYGIVADSLAQTTGLRSGDKILALDGKKVQRFEEIPLKIILDNVKTMEIDRDGKPETIHLPADLSGIVINKHLHFLGAGDIRIPVQPLDSIVYASPAQLAGLKKGDMLISVDSVPIAFWDQFTSAVKEHKSKLIHVAVLRGADTQRLALTVPAEGIVGVSIQTKDLSKEFQYDTIHYSLLQALPAGVSKGCDMLVSYVRQLKLLFGGKVNISEGMSGPVGIANLFPATWDWQAFWTLTAFLSMILAIMNLLPIPGLDGGHALFCVYEMITGRKPSDKFMEYAQTVGMIILLALMVFAFGNDIFRLFKH